MKNVLRTPKDEADFKPHLVHFERAARACEGNGIAHARERLRKGEKLTTFFAHYQMQVRPVVAKPVKTKAGRKYEARKAVHVRHKILIEKCRCQGCGKVEDRNSRVRNWCNCNPKAPFPMYSLYMCAVAEDCVRQVRAMFGGR